MSDERVHRLPRLRVRRGRHARPERVRTNLISAREKIMATKAKQEERPEARDAGRAEAEANDRLRVVLQFAHLVVTEVGTLHMSMHIGEPDEGPGTFEVEEFPWLTQDECAVLNGENGYSVLTGPSVIGRALDSLVSRARGAPQEARP